MHTRRGLDEYESKLIIRLSPTTCVTTKFIVRYAELRRSRHVSTEWNNLRTRAGKAGKFNGTRDLMEHNKFYTMQMDEVPDSATL